MPLPQLARQSRPACLAACLLLAAIGSGGCSVSPATAPPSVALPGSQVEANSPRTRSLERALSSVNGDTVRAWINRYTAPKNGAAIAPTQPRAIYIDVDILARRHAAWQLADELQGGALAPTKARQIGVATLASSAQSARGKRALPHVLAIPAPATLPVRPARALSATESNDAAQRNSRATLNDFLAALRTRQIALEGAQTDLERQALENRIRAATRGAVEAVELEPVSPETALELSNLRLQLLAQLRVPAAKQAAAAAEIERIEARLNAIWSAQTAAQNARLRAALEELPARLRREGLAALDQAAARRQSERAATNAELRRTIEARLSAAAPATNAQILRLLLPPARVADASFTGSPDGFFQTRAANTSSQGGRNAGMNAALPDPRVLSQTAGFGEDTIAELRAQARRDARQWARNLALNWGTKLGDKTAPDRTAQAVMTLFTSQP